MITFFTGLPRNGKTLRAIAEAEAERARTQRPVFYFGIAGLKLPWIKLEKPEAWVDCPDGALIVIDEIQENGFPARSNSQKAPEHVAKLATHGHRGLDLFLITQHPRMADPFVRSLANRHMHVVRKWGTQAATVHEWSAVNDNCHKSRKDSVRHDWKYPKQVFDWYHSASEHNMKVRIPARVIIFWCLPFVFAALAYAAYVKLSGFGKPKDAPAPGAAPAATGVMAQQPAKPAHMSTADYVAQFAPRVAGLAYTAPAYDEIAKPVHAPYPAACVQMADVCRCYSQQATRLDVPAALCASIVAGGFFVPWDSKEPPEVRSAAIERLEAREAPRPALLSLGGDPRAHVRDLR